MAQQMPDETRLPPRLPAKLYKYRPFHVNTLRAMTEAEIFYAWPATFNDPLDCDPTLEVDIGRASLEQLLIAMLQRHMRKDEAVKDVII